MTMVIWTFLSSAPVLPGISLWALCGMRGESPLQGGGVAHPIHPFLASEMLSLLSHRTWPVFLAQGIPP